MGGSGRHDILLPLIQAVRGGVGMGREGEVIKERLNRYQVN
jgi:hypothetical protein